MGLPYIALNVGVALDTYNESSPQVKPSPYASMPTNPPVGERNWSA